MTTKQETIRPPRKGHQFTVDEERGRKIRVFPTVEEAVRAETFLRRLHDAPGINVPRLYRRESEVLHLEYLPGRPVTRPPHGEMIVAVANLQARIHAIEWPEVEQETCALEYLRYFLEYLQVFARLGLASERLSNRMARQFEAAIPWRMHPALIHDDLWGGNLLWHEADFFLIDYASVKALALESDLLNSSRYFHTLPERMFRGPYSLRTRYIRAYAANGPLMREAAQSLAMNKPFFLAFNLMRKGANMLERIPADEVGNRKGMVFAMRRLREARRALRA